jgi:uncharacterized cupin superfamily protein
MRRISIVDPDFEYDENDPEGFRNGALRLGPHVGATQLGASVYELPPGQAVCPYHYEHGEEEWMVVLDGSPTVRHPDGEEKLDRWDVVCFPTGPEGAHQVRNDTDEPARVLMFSSVVYPQVSVYPDSDKIGVYTRDRTDNLIVHRDSGVDYFSGEGG